MIFLVSQIFSILTRYFQYYSMDCYFRQYWRDQRLSFKGLKNNANNLVINQLRRVSKVGWAAVKVNFNVSFCVGIPLLHL